MPSPSLLQRLKERKLVQPTTLFASCSVITNASEKADGRRQAVGA